MLGTRCSFVAQGEPSWDGFLVCNEKTALNYEGGDKVTLHTTSSNTFKKVYKTILLNETNKSWEWKINGAYTYKEKTRPFNPSTVITL